MANFSYEIFAQVVTTNNFGQAAKILNVTPSAVSHAISQLEHELGFPLFIRNRTGVEHTRWPTNFTCHSAHFKQ